jgi:hypothetical protein
MHESYPSVPLSIKEVRLLLRRINKSIRILDFDDFDFPVQIDSESLNQLSDLICAKAFREGVTNGFSTASSSSAYFVDEDPLNILNELI